LRPLLFPGGSVLRNRDPHGVFSRARAPSFRHRHRGLLLPARLALLPRGEAKLRVFMSDRDTSSERVIRLDQFLKLVGAMRTGGEAKHAIQSGEVEVNGEVDTRRSRKLREGDTVDCRGSHWVVTKEALDELEPGEEIA